MRSASETSLLTGLRAVELLLNRFQRRQDLRQFGRLVDFPALLRRETNARSVRPTALVAAAERCRRRPGRRNQLGDRQAGCENRGLQSRNVLLVRSMHDRLREQGLATAMALQERAGRDTGRWAPYRGGSACTTPWRRRLRVDPGSRENALKSFRRTGSEPQGEVGGQHGSARDALTGRGHPALLPAARRHPSASTGSAPAGLFVELPFVAEQDVERIVVAPHSIGVAGPDDFQAAADCMSPPMPVPKLLFQPKALLLDAGSFRLRAPHTYSHRRRHGSCRRCARRQ